MVGGVWGVMTLHGANDPYDVWYSGHRSAYGRMCDVWWLLMSGTQVSIWLWVGG